MKNIDYSVKRNNIYIGIVSDAISFLKDRNELNGIYNPNESVVMVFPGEDQKDFERDYSLQPFIIDKVKSGKMIHFNQDSRRVFESASFRRTTIFTLDENGLANDLLYDAPHYPVCNISDDNKCLDSDFAISLTINVSRLLEYFGYKEDLGYEDILSIRDFFLTHKFLKEYSEILFEGVHTSTYVSEKALRAFKYNELGLFGDRYPYFFMEYLERLEEHLKNPNTKENIRPLTEKSKPKKDSTKVMTMCMCDNKSIMEDYLK